MLLKRLMDIQLNGLISSVEVIPKRNDDVKICEVMRQNETMQLKVNFPYAKYSEHSWSNEWASVVIENGSIARNSRDLPWWIVIALSACVTHDSIYMYTRFMFGISCSPELYQRTIKQEMRDSCKNISDYIIVFAETKERHDRTLRCCLKDTNLTQNKDKCLFSQS